MEVRRLYLCLPTLSGPWSQIGGGVWGLVPDSWSLSPAPPLAGSTDSQDCQGEDTRRNNIVWAWRWQRSAGVSVGGRSCAHPAPKGPHWEMGAMGWEMSSSDSLSRALPSPIAPSHPITWKVTCFALSGMQFPAIIFF